MRSTSCFLPLLLLGLSSLAIILIRDSIPIDSQYYSLTSSFLDDDHQNIYEQEFIKFIATYGKSYQSKHEVPVRFANFIRTYRMIENHNKLNKNHKLAIN